MLSAMFATFIAVCAASPARHRVDRLAHQPRATASASRPGPWVAVAAVLGWVVLAVALGSRAAVLAAVVGLVLGTGWLLWQGRTRQTRARRHAAEVAHGCAVLAAEVRAGRTPHQGLVVIAEEFTPFRPVAAASRVGGSVPEALEQGARTPGFEGLRQLARAWAVSERTGSELGPALDAVAAGLRSDQAVARATSTELAASRATGQLLGVLPVVGIVLGFVLGGNPVEFLLNSTAGLACLFAGVLLTCAGVLWSERLASP